VTAVRPSAVLIVDDDPFIRRLIATTLEDVAGFELIQAADGEEALELADQRTEPRVRCGTKHPHAYGGQ